MRNVEIRFKVIHCLNGIDFYSELLATWLTASLVPRILEISSEVSLRLMFSSSVASRNVCPSHFLGTDNWYCSCQGYMCHITRTYFLFCHISRKADKWPKKLLMQLIPQNLLVSLPVNTNDTHRQFRASTSKHLRLSVQPFAQNVVLHEVTSGKHVACVWTAWRRQLKSWECVGKTKFCSQGSLMQKLSLD